MGNTISIFDSTLRDGAQAHGISFSVGDKLKIARKLDEIGVAYIEAGNPTSNPKDMEFFTRARTELVLKNAKLCAFGSTRRPGLTVDQDPALQALVDSGTAVTAIFGKAWDFHVLDIIRTTLDENVAMITDSISFLKDRGKEVIFDAEHFFDGYKNNPQYALRVLSAAADAGADWLVLCDTNGGTLPLEVYQIVQSLIQQHGIGRLGIHCHNDVGTAVASSLLAVQAGALHIQGTFTGIGERCGNANLTTIIADLQLKLGMRAIPDGNVEELFTAYRYICEVCNIIPDERNPFVGTSAFAHKGGMHIDAVNKNPISFEHVAPESVGNERKFLMSEVAGRSTILAIIKKVDSTIGRDSEVTQRILNKLKEKEYHGFQYEGAEHSLELLIRKELGLFQHSFELVEYKIIVEHDENAKDSALAVVRIRVDGVLEEAVVSSSNGPVHALDMALRKALCTFYDDISNMYLLDYKVRVIDGNSATRAKVRVLIETTDGVSSWATVGVSQNIIEASWNALIDSVEYKLLKQESCEL